MKAFNGIDYEKEWQELLSNEASLIQDSSTDDEQEIAVESFYHCAQFVRANLSQLPEVRELIGAVKEMINDCGCITPWRIELEEIVEKLEGGK